MPSALPVTVLGAGGWLGRSVVSELQSQGRLVQPVRRETLDRWLMEVEPAGAVIDAIGLTADFRRKPFETVKAHVSVLSQVMQRPGIQTLIYLSSTRVYARSAITSEAAALPCLSSDPSDLYNLSKLTGEALVLQDPRPGFKAVRLSNVVGEGQPSTTFVGSLLQEARQTGRVQIRQPPHTAKDYIALPDVCRLLAALTGESKERLYNLGSGRNTSHLEIAGWLESHGVRVAFAEQGEAGISFPVLDTQRLNAEYGSVGNPFEQRLL
jgi:nucleoside-diphosphate-sugar epimerase